jgi:hypothetical protein
MCVHSLLWAWLWQLSLVSKLVDSCQLLWKCGSNTGKKGTSKQASSIRQSTSCRFFWSRLFPFGISRLKTRINMHTHFKWYLQWTSASLWLSQPWTRTPPGTCSREHLPASAPKAWGSSMVQMHKGPPRANFMALAGHVGIEPWYAGDGYGYHWSGHCPPQKKTVQKVASESPTDWENINNNYS